LYIFSFDPFLFCLSKLLSLLRIDEKFENEIVPEPKAKEIKPTLACVYARAFDRMMLYTCQSLTMNRETIQTRLGTVVVISLALGAGTITQEIYP